MATAQADSRGLKRVCVSCGIRFYDLNKRPISCPNCSTEFTGEIKLKTRRGRAAAAEAALAESAATTKPANDENFEEIEATADTISLEEVEKEPDEAEEDIELEGGDIETLADIEDDIEDDLDDEDLEVKIEKE